MKGAGWIAFLAGGVGLAWFLMAQKKKKEAEALAAAAQAAALAAPAPPPKTKTKTKKKTPTPPPVPTPGYSFAGTVIGNCLFNGGPGVILEYDDGSTECVAAVDLTVE